MSDKPTYLGLLNAISNAETEAECYLNAWAAVTPRDDVRGVLATVALREGEHGKSFAKRMCELGYGLQPRSDGKLAEKMAIAASTTLSDREKFEKLDLCRPVDPTKPDFFAGMMNDSTIDIHTGELLGRYIAEERDSGRMLRACYGALCADDTANGTANRSASNGAAGNGASNGAPGDRLARIEQLLEQLVTKLSA